MLRAKSSPSRLRPRATRCRHHNGTVTGITEAGLTSTAAKDGADGVAVDFNSLTSPSQGRCYTFTMSENVPADENKAGGVTYDGHDCTVTVNVTLEQGNGRA